MAKRKTSCCEYHGINCSGEENARVPAVFEVTAYKKVRRKKKKMKKVS